METSESARAFRRTQWRMLFALMFCYLFYYTGRQNFGWAIPLMLEDEGLGLTATDLGYISGTMLMVYGIGQFINGNLGDKFGGRKMMTMGGLFSCVLNWVTSLGNSFWSIMAPWMANGYAQSMGWAPGSRLLSNWWAHSERGKAFGLYVCSAACSTVLIFFLAAGITLMLLPWQWIFRLPVLLLALACIAFYFVARNKPEDLGFKPLPSDLNQGSETQAEAEAETSIRRYLHVLKNPRFLLASLSIGFESFARYGLIIWVPLHYLGPGWRDNPGTVWVPLALAVGMAFGAVSTGYLSDRFFQANRSRPIAMFMGLAMIVLLLIYVVPQEMKLIGMVLLFLAGFLVYGPQSCYWALCPDLFGRRRAATAIGVMNFCAYFMAAAGEPFLGWIIDFTGGTTAIFAVLAASCALSAVLILPVKR